MKIWNPELYSTNNSFQYKTSINLIKALNIEAQLNILDIGSGDGKISAYLADYFPLSQVLGIDKSKEMVAYARKKYDNYNNLKFAISDAETLIFIENFNLIVSFWAISWFVNHQIFIKNIYSALKPNGKIILIAPLNNLTFEEAIHSVYTQKKWFKYFNNGFNEHKNTVSEKLYENLLQINNFKNFNIKNMTFYKKYNSLTDLSNFVASWLQHLTFIPDCKKREFMNEIILAYINRNKNNHKLTVSFDALIIDGNK